LVRRPAIALDRLGFVLQINAQAEEVFDDDIFVRHRRLVLPNSEAKAAFDRLVDQLRTTPEHYSTLPFPAVVIRRRSKSPVVINVLPIGAAARSPFLGARVLLVLSDLSRSASPRPDVLSRTFGLSAAEARLAALIATGISPEAAAGQLGIAKETARTQLKSVFTKTATHRQSELVALLLRL
jgi:DNA-binding CsgD family transcriptional regulator